ncbi:MAG TPA: hypothetical protein VFW11_14355 [Cyclobacteriaceae bacterium]|nr:hypothetical protein [Cyclobacteriaceae bacterium]
MSPVVLVHFSPVELYPPIQNLVRVLEKEASNRQFVLITTIPSVDLTLFEASSVQIKRKGKIDVKASAWRRFVNYIFFHLFTLQFLIRYRPDTVIYFETLSSFPVYLYKRYIKRGARIFIHYHEYTSTDEYQNGRRLPRLFHLLEKKLYAGARWVSHTNEVRMKKFKEDISPLIISNDHLLPNYPPSTWRTNPPVVNTLPIKIIYAGALSLSTMYTREFAEWVLDQDGKAVWDIYSFNYSPDARDYLTGLNSPWIRFNQGVNYDRLPTVLRAYHAGVILYKGHTPNYVYNAPNKLFEYLVCGLDVWFPKEMRGCYPYITEGHYPKVVCIDFRELHQLDLQSLISKENHEFQDRGFYCEPVYENFYQVVTKNQG